jgi:hypothetical protein
MGDYAEENKAQVDISSAIGNLLSNPEALSKMSEILSKITSSENGSSSPPDPVNSDNIQESPDEKANITENSEGKSPTFQNFDTGAILSKMPDILSKLSTLKSEDSIATKQQINLLLAIRPYLSPHRKELIDTFVKMNKLGAIFKNLT